MVTEHAKKRARILSFWDRYGLEATIEAFGVSRRTLYSWKRARVKSDGTLESLNPVSRAPKTRRKRLWPEKITSEIRRIREEHPNLGKEKIHPFLKIFCDERTLVCPSVRTIGRIIADTPDKMRIFPQKVRHNGTVVVRKRRKVTRKPQGFKATRPGECLAFDTVERIIHGSRRYVVTAVDLYSRFSLAFATTSHASKAASEFFSAIKTLFPYKIDYVLTDNGSEFMKHFDTAVREACNDHWHTYPKTPKMNAHCERFNRTIQEEFVDYHTPLLLDPPSFNLKLADYLIWYNGQRPHHSLKLKSPVQFLQSNHQECNLWWPNTNSFLSA